MTTSRISIFIGAIISLIILPWYVSSLLLIIGLILFDFVEGFFIAFLMDMLYGFSSPIYGRFLFLIYFFILYFVFRNAKKWIRIGSR